MLPDYFNIRSLPHGNFIPNWRNVASFWLPKPTKIASGSRLGLSWARLGSLLRHLGLIFERPGGVLERLERVLERLGASGARLDWNYVTGPPGSQLRRAPGADNKQKEERLSAEKLQILKRVNAETECRRPSEYKPSECKV